MSFGSKADNLIILTKNNIKVPRFFVVDTQPFTEKDLACSFEQNPDMKLVRKFSVRSSSSLEDGTDLSFAGQFTTFLDVECNDIEQKIKDCFMAISSDSIDAYMTVKNHDKSAIKMSVIVQEMIDSDYSGVLFTANPRGLLSESVLVVGKGTGDGVVEDKVPTTTYYKDNFTGVCYFETTNGSPILEDGLITQIFDIAVKIKKIFAKEMDIEFAIKSGEVYILQARPITTLSKGKTIILDNSNLVESYPGLTSPLTASFIEDAYAGVCGGVVQRLAGKEIFTQDELNSMVVSCNGRMYYTLNSWYEIINLLPFSRLIIPIWEHSLGLSATKNSHKKISNLTKIKVIKNVLKIFLQIPSKMDELDLTFRDTRKYFNDKFSPNLSNLELIGLYKKIEKRIFSEWDITLANDLYAFVYAAAVKKKCGEAANLYIGSVANLASMQPLRELKKILDFIIKNGHKEDIEKLNSDDDVEVFLKSDGKLPTMILDYIEDYGDRYVEELKLESPTYRTNPLLLINQINLYLKSGALNNLNDTQAIDLPKNRNLARKIIKARLGIKNREVSRLNRTRIYGIVRRIFLAIASNFVEQNILKQVDDIFYLTVDEITAIINGSQINARDLVVERRLRYEYFESLPQFSRLLFAGKVSDKNQVSQPQNFSQKNEAMSNVKKLQGTPCSAGEVCGEAIIVSSPKSGIDASGKIIIAKSTDPGWVFLLSSASGIVVERGSILSHTAIISRELQIPSIVGVDGIMTVIKSGQMIKINGNTGEVNIL